MTTIDLPGRFAWRIGVAEVDRFVAACIGLFLAAPVEAQTIQQVGPWPGRHPPAYSPQGGSSSPFVVGSGPAGRATVANAANSAGGTLPADMPLSNILT